MTGEANKRARHGHEDNHLGKASRNHGDHDGLDGVGDEQRSRPTLLKAATNADEESGSDGTTNGDELCGRGLAFVWNVATGGRHGTDLNLAVAKVALELVGILGALDDTDVCVATGIALLLVEAAVVGVVHRRRRLVDLFLTHGCRWREVESGSGLARRASRSGPRLMMDKYYTEG